MSTRDSSIEFDMYEEIRRKLSRHLVGRGKSMIDAERIALYTVQGIQAMPKLLTVLSQTGVHQDAQISQALRDTLEGALPLTKARAIFMNEKDIEATN
ncbi:MAG: hypothetical protein MSG64_09330 [Pyrinomonadaceae bacterium MAG19_C2-C3]|nr:hypothetical protein [Pyrinomonadaceae bacterium MAG19_C2-C3]